MLEQILDGTASSARAARLGAAIGSSSALGAGLVMHVC